MNLRPSHNTSNSPIGTIAYGVPANVLEVWTSTTNTTLNNIGDIWARLSDKPEWVAVIHKGIKYGELTESGGTDPIPPTPNTPTFPDSFTLTDPSGAKAEYKFVRIIEE